MSERVLQAKRAFELLAFIFAAIVCMAVAIFVPACSSRPEAPALDPRLAIVRSDKGEPMLRELPPLEELRVVRNLDGGDTFHFKNGEPRDNFADGQMGIGLNGDALEYWLVGRMGNFGRGFSRRSGGVFFRKKYDGNPFLWPESSRQFPKGKSIPSIVNSPSQGNIDTHVFGQNPETLVTTFLHGTKPGWRAASNGSGQTFAIQRATSERPTKDPKSFRRFPQELVIAPELASPWERPKEWKKPNGASVWFGGSGECSLVIDPPLAIIFFESKTTEAPDVFGQRFRSRLGRAVCQLADLDNAPVFERDPAPGPGTWVFSPPDDPNYGSTNETAIWGTAQVTLRGHVSVSPWDGSYHFVWIGSTPAINNRGEPANGKINAKTGIGHAWSHDKGRTWTRSERNPLYTWESVGVVQPAGGPVGNRFNAPFLMWDPWRREVFLGLWLNKVDTMNQPGTKLYLARGVFQ